MSDAPRAVFLSYAREDTEAAREFLFFVQGQNDPSSQTIMTLSLRGGGNGRSGHEYQAGEEATHGKVWGWRRGHGTRPRRRSPRRDPPSMRERRRTGR